MRGNLFCWRPKTRYNTTTLGIIAQHQQQVFLQQPQHRFFCPGFIVYVVVRNEKMAIFLKYLLPWHDFVRSNNKKERKKLLENVKLSTIQVEWNGANYLGRQWAHYVPPSSMYNAHYADLMRRAKGIGEKRQRQRHSQKQRWMEMEKEQKIGRKKQWWNYGYPIIFLCKKRFTKNLWSLSLSLW